jgi:hypothetical protein
MCLGSDCRSSTTWPAYITNSSGRGSWYIGIRHDNVAVPESVTLLKRLAGVRFESGPRYRNLSLL